MALKFKMANIYHDIYCTSSMRDTSNVEILKMLRPAPDTHSLIVAKWHQIVS